MFPDVKDPKDLTLDQLLDGLRKFEKEIPLDPSQREFANLKRNPDTHTFSDDDLVEILTSMASSDLDRIKILINS